MISDPDEMLTKQMIGIIRNDFLGADVGRKPLLGGWVSPEKLFWPPQWLSARPWYIFVARLPVPLLHDPLDLGLSILALSMDLLRVLFGLLLDWWPSVWSSSALERLDLELSRRLFSLRLLRWLRSLREPKISLRLRRLYAWRRARCRWGIMTPEAMLRRARPKSESALSSTIFSETRPQTIRARRYWYRQTNPAHELAWLAGVIRRQKDRPAGWSRSCRWLHHSRASSIASL